MKDEIEKEIKNYINGAATFCFFNGRQYVKEKRFLYIKTIEQLSTQTFDNAFINTMKQCIFKCPEKTLQASDAGLVTDYKTETIALNLNFNGASFTASITQTREQKILQGMITKTVKNKGEIILETKGKAEEIIPTIFNKLMNQNPSLSQRQRFSS